jgi:hypothetical protein
VAEVDCWICVSFLSFREIDDFWVFFLECLYYFTYLPLFFGPYEYTRRERLKQLQRVLLYIRGDKPSSVSFSRLILIGVKVQIA